MTVTFVAAVQEQSQVGAARRESLRLASEAGLSQARSSDLAIVVTELATNLTKHAGGGRLLLQRLDAAHAGPGVEVLALDRGPGMEDTERCLRDGYSTAGSPGNGLGAIRRLASEFEVFSRPHHGTLAVARVYEPGVAGGLGASPAFIYGGISVPVHGETRCGDAYRVYEELDRCAILLVDGLGHGPLAADAAEVAVATFDRHCGESPPDLVERIHDALRGTRGAAVAVARIDPGSGVLRFCGLGNIGAAIAEPGLTRRMVSHSGTAGQGSPRFKEFTYPWSTGSVLVMHSDGLTSRWDLDAYQGILVKHPSLAAGALYRDFERGRDDATVLAVRRVRR